MNPPPPPGALEPRISPAAQPRETILDRIVAQKRIEIRRLPGPDPTPAQLRAAASRRGSTRDFPGALASAAPGAPALIAEIKKASPSAGVIQPDFDPVRMAREYAAAGAHCLSVLTDERFFGGALDHLRQIRAAVGLPLLRKDFIVDARQILESIECGADAILLIVAILSEGTLRRFLELASAGGLAALVEVRDERELERALAAGARMIGVNNRDLRTFRVDLATTERLAARLAPPAAGGILLVAESGIHGRADVERLRRCGARAVLVGESLMRSGDPGAKVRELLGTRP